MTDTVPAPSTSAPCSLHRTHRPITTGQEEHHVIPQAWQRLWQPPNSMTLAGVLWDPRTVPICPTGHRNVHHWLVRVVRATYAVLLEGGGPVRGDTYESALIVALGDAGLPSHGHREEIDCALLALERWYAVGGLVRTLGDAREWGEA